MFVFSLPTSSTRPRDVSEATLEELDHMASFDVALYILYVNMYSIEIYIV